MKRRILISGGILIIVGLIIGLAFYLHDRGHTPPVELAITEPAPTETLLPTQTDTPVPTSTVSPTPTQTGTPLPTFTPYPTPEVPLSNTGPWLITHEGKSSGGTVFAMNADFTGKTRLFSGYVFKSSFAVVEDGIDAAGLIYEEEPQCCEWHLKRLWLKISHVPVMQEVRAIPITDIVGDLEPGCELWVFDMELSPDGSKVAIIAGIYGETLGIYIYDVETGATTQISGNQLVGKGAGFLEWSPDGEYFVFYNDMIGDSGSQNTYDVVSIKADGSNIRSLFYDIDQPTPFQPSSYWLSYTWHDDTTIQISAGTKDETNPIGQRYLIDVASGEYSLLYSYEYQLPDGYGPGWGTYIDKYDIFISEFEDPETEAEALFFHGSAGWTEIPLESEEWYLHWLEQYDLFVMITYDANLWTITPKGELTKLPGSLDWPYYRLHTSPAENIWLWHFKGPPNGDHTALWLNKPFEAPQQIITWKRMNEEMGDWLWTLEGDGVLLLLKDRRCVVYPPDFELECVPMDNDDLFDAYWLP